MYKKIILALVCLSFTLSGFAAKLTATLQSGDKITPFYGANAFVEAYNAAVNGDIITLSPGEFNVTNIEKSITVIGSYAFSTDLSIATQFSASVTVSEDNVTLEGLRFTNNTSGKGLIIKGADNLTINRCYINTFNDEEKENHKYHNNTIITDSWIELFYAMSLSQNAVLRNCCINYFQDMNEIDKPALIEICNVSSFRHSIGNNRRYRYSTPYAIYRNCCLGLYKNEEPNSETPSLDFSAPSEFYNNCFYEKYYYSSASLYSYYWTINYGSAAHSNNISIRIFDQKTGVPFPFNGSFSPYVKDGISYGPVNHKEYPAIPSVTASEIDTQTDAEGNLHVKITATARD
jgi:hypothetical protein